ASDNFKKEFEDFLPSKRLNPGPDGKLGDKDDQFTPKQLARLDTLLDHEAAQLGLAVRLQFAPVNTADGTGIMFVDSGGDVTVRWNDVFIRPDGVSFTAAGLPSIGPPPAAKPNYAFSPFDRNDKFLRDTLTNVPRSRFNLPEVSQEWAL